MFTNLSTGRKLFILCLTFVIAIVVPIFSLVQDRRATVEFTKKQLVGSHYLAALRGTYARILSSVPDNASRLQPAPSSDEVLNALEAAEASSGGAMQTAEVERTLATILHALWSSDAARTPTNSFVLDALAVSRELASRIGSDSNLALDPNPDTYYLQDIVVQKLPEILSYLGEEQTLFGEVAAAGRFSSERRGRLLMLDGLLRSTTLGLKSDVALAYRTDIDGLKRKLDADVSEMVRNVGLYFNAADEKLAEDDAGVIDPRSLGALYTAAVESSLKAWETVQSELDRLITERIADLNAKMLRSLLVTGALGFISIVLAVITYRNIVRPLERVEHVVRKVRETKDYHLRIDHVGQDEIGRLGDAFNNMLSELSAARRRERRLVDANIIGIFSWDFEGQILEANDAFLRMVGYDREDLASGRLRWRDLTPPEWLERHAQQWVPELKLTGSLQPYEKEYFRKDGSRVPVLVGAATFEQGGNQGVTFVLDLTDRKRSEQALREREAKIRRLVDANLIGVFVADLEGRIVEANDAFLRIVGYEREYLISGRMHVVEMTPPEWRDRSARTMADIKLRKTVQPYEKEYFRKDGSRVPVLVGSTIFDESNLGVALGLVFVVELTELKRAEAEARESERRYREVQMELAHANRIATMGQLTASIAHEVNQPIAATVTNAQAALRFLDARTVDLNEVREILNDIVRDGNRAGQVISRIRDLIKKAPPRSDRWEINEAIREVIEFTRGEAVKNGVSVHTELADGLPLIQGDRVQLQQVILNLIINAIEAMSSLSERPRELLVGSGKAEPGGVLVTVRDSGPGLAPAALGRVFESFYTTKPSGLGLGLSICRSIVQAHGGRLWASANDTAGATFQFTVPADEGNRCRRVESGLGNVRTGGDPSSGISSVTPRA